MITGKLKVMSGVLAVDVFMADRIDDLIYLVETVK